MCPNLTTTRTHLLRATIAGPLLVAFWLSSAGAAPVFGPRSDFAVGPEPVALVVGDLNGDGRPDLAVLNNTLVNNSGMSVLLGRGNGAFGPRADFGVSWNSRSIAIADLNSDGIPDLVTGSEWNEVHTWSGNGDGTFGAQTDELVGQIPLTVAVADLNGDGKPDLIAANYHDLSPEVSILLGTGHGTFAGQQGFGNGIGPRALAVSDLNADGKPDVVVVNARRDFVSILLGVGDGTFPEEKHMGVGIQPTALAIADLNGDGYPDLAVAGNHQTVAILLGKGDGTFTEAATVGVGIYPGSVAIADLDGDGRSDLAVANAESNSVSVAAGNGDGTFQDAFELRTGDSPSSISIADINGDGKPDLLVSNSGSNTVSVFLNETPPLPLGARLAIGVASNPVTGRLTLGVRLPRSGSADVEVFDPAGRIAAQRNLLASGRSQEVSFSEAAGWKPGVYLVRVRQGSAVATARACILR